MPKAVKSGTSKPKPPKPLVNETASANASSMSDQNCETEMLTSSENERNDVGSDSQTRKHKQIKPIENSEAAEMAAKLLKRRYFKLLCNQNR